MFIAGPVTLGFKQVTGSRQSSSCATSGVLEYDTSGYEETTSFTVNACRSEQVMSRTA